MVSKSDAFVQDFVLGFGFLGGLFTWVGVDPEEEIVRALLIAALPDNAKMVTLVIVLFVFVSTTLAILGTYKMAGGWGLVVVGMAWISGFIVSIGETSALVGIAFLFIALFLGQKVCENYRG